FEEKRIRERHPEAPVDQRLVGAHRRGMAGHHILRQSSARRKQLSRLDHTIYEPPLRGELGAQKVSGERELLRAHDADQARQLLAEPPAGEHADARVRIGETRVARCDEHVAGERDLEAAGDRYAVDCADDRLRARLHRADQVSSAPDRLARARTWAALAAELLEIEAGRE